MNYILKKIPWNENNLPWLKKSLFIMRCILLFLLIGTLQSFAEVVYSQTVKFSLNMENATVQNVLATIEQKSDFYFTYNLNEVNATRMVSISMNNKTVMEVLDRLFVHTNIHYIINDKHIVLYKSDEVQIKQQAKKVSGVITDSKGEVVIGANVVEKGTTNGTITDVNGKFTLSVSNNSVLTVSYIGYKAEEIPLKGRSSINVVLSEDSKVLDEVVVVGYGTMKKSDLTSSISVVSSKDLQERKVTQLSEALQGTVSGLTVTRSSGSAEGGASNLYIRGITTMSTNNPLVLIDGIPGSLDAVNPNDVENMSVLKDAASASIYGSRAAAGVILITTKRAKADDLSLSYDFQFNYEKPTALGDVIDMNSYMAYQNESNYNNNPDGGWYQVFTQDQTANWVEWNKADPDKYPIVDTKSLYSRYHATSSKHSLNISGGSKFVRTKFSYVHDDDGSISDFYYYKRNMIRMNNDFTINKYLSGSVDLSFSNSLQRSPHWGVNSSQSGISLGSVYSWQLQDPWYWSDGRFAEGKGGGNPYADVWGDSFHKYQMMKLNTKFSFVITPFEGLKLTGTYSPGYQWSKNKYNKVATYWTYLDDPSSIGGYFYDLGTSYLQEERQDNHDRTKQLFINYDKTLGKHSLSFTGGYEDHYEFNEYLAASRDQSSINGYPYLDIWPDNYDSTTGKVLVNYAYRSWFSRLGYSYANKYLLQLNIRRDGSSRFSKDYRWGTFPSASAGWVISEEPFMKNTQNWLSFLKLRASFGELGNERIGSYFPYQSGFSLGQVFQYMGGVATAYQSSYPNQYAINDITWEKTKSLDLGLDTRLLNDRLNLTFDWYHKNTTDMLLAVQIPRYMGFTNPSINAGDMHTNGWDLQLGWRDKISEFNYAVTANLSDYTSTMGYLKGTEFLGSQIIREGSEYQEWYGYICDGIYKTAAEVESSAKLNNKQGVGDLKYKDISGPNGVPDGAISPEYDRVLLGSSSPHYQFGLTLSGSYRNWDINVMFQGVGKWNKMRTREMSDASGTLMSGEWDDLGFYWSSKNTDDQNTAAKYPRLGMLYNYSSETTSNFWMMNGRYVRLKNLSIGYTLPTALINKVGIKNLRLFVTGTDLFSLSKYPKEFDPELGVSTYPLMKNFIFGASIKF